MCNAAKSRARAYQAEQAREYISGLYENTQVQGWIGALMAKFELLGMNRKHASVFVKRVAEGMYQCTYTMINGPPARVYAGRNCIVFTYMVHGRVYTDYKYITWENCRKYLDEFRTHGVMIKQDHKAIEFVCDSVHHLELLRPE